MKHKYLSTHCWHGHHDTCRLTCKFCPEKCVCPCHTDPIDLEKAIKEIVAFSDPVVAQ